MQKETFDDIISYNLKSISTKREYKRESSGYIEAMRSRIYSFIYFVLSAIGVIPSVSEDKIVTILLAAVSFLSNVCVLVDPTTAGLDDSDKAMTYEKPHKDI